MNLAPAAVYAQNAVPDIVAHEARSDASTEASASGAGGDDISFSDVLSALNPLQYLPVVGTIYRAITGDRPAPGWRLGGSAVAGFLMGGPLGVVTSLIGVGLEELCTRITDAASSTGTPDETVPDAVTRSTALAAYQKTDIYLMAGGSG